MLIDIKNNKYTFDAHYDNQTTSFEYIYLLDCNIRYYIIDDQKLNNNTLSNLINMSMPYTCICKQCICKQCECNTNNMLPNSSFPHTCIDTNCGLITSKLINSKLINSKINTSGYNKIYSYCGNIPYTDLHYDNYDSFYNEYTKLLVEKIYDKDFEILKYFDAVKKYPYLI